jgi:hypothetical protein
MKFALILLLVTSSFGCASYHLGHYKRALPGGYDRVAIPVFQNKTEEVGIETFFTKSLRTEFERSHLATVTSKNDAQVIIEGVITKSEFVGGAPTNRDDTAGLQTPNVLDPNYPNPLPVGTTLNRSYSSNLVIKIFARKVADNSVLWQGEFTSSRSYNAPLIGSPQFAFSNPIYNQSSRISTVEQQAKDLMAEAHDRLTENF